MFRLGNSSNNDNSLESQSLLYSASEALLGGSLLTPDPDAKFDTHADKIQDASFGEYDGLRLYDQYNDSGPSSIQFGDGTGTSEHSESHVNGTGDATAGAARSVAEDSSLESTVENGGDGVFLTKRVLAPQFPLVNGNHKDADSSTLSTLSIFSRSPNHPDSIIQPASAAGKSPAMTMAANTSVVAAIIFPTILLTLALIGWARRTLQNRFLALQPSANTLGARLTRFQKLNFVRDHPYLRGYLGWNLLGKVFWLRIHPGSVLTPFI
jgi:hypothetical protein